MNIFNLSIIYILLTLPFLLIGLLYLYKIYVNNDLFDHSFLARMRNYQYFYWQNKLKIIFLAMSLIFLIVVLWQPAWGAKQKTIETKGVDVVFTLDVSQSMQALDVGDGNTDRLSLAKSMINDFVSKHPENRYGLVIFSGEAFVSSPLTIDAGAFLTFLSGVDYHDVSSQGTNIKAALQASINRFYSEQDKKRGRAIVIISDGGEDMQLDASDFAKVTKKLGIKIFTIGIGSTKGVPIPERRDVFGRISYKRYHGQTVLTKLNEKPLKKIAKITGGKYFHANSSGSLHKIVKELSILETSSIKSQEKIGQEDRYQYFLVVSLLFFVLYLLFNLINIDFNINKKIRRYLKLSVFLLFFLLSGCTNNNLFFRYYNTMGNKSYNQAYYDEAKTKYQQAGKKSHTLKYIADNNLALSNYQEDNYQVASKILEKTVAIYCQKNSIQYCDELYYNLGDIYYRQGEELIGKKQISKWQLAIEAFKKDLEINPQDKEAQENIDFITNKIKKSVDNQQQKEDNSEQNSSSTKFSQDQTDNQSASNSQDKENSGESSNDQKKDDLSKQSNNESSDKTNEQDQLGKNNADKNNDNNFNSQSTTAQNDDEQLDAKTKEQIDKYMQALDQQEKQSQDYFQPNPNGSYKSQDNLEDFFNDPFFNDFFGNFRGSRFKGQEGSNEGIDW